MNSIKDRKRSSLQMVAISFLHLSVIPLSLALLIQVLTQSAMILKEALSAEEIAAFTAQNNPVQGKWLAAALFFVLAAIRVLMAFQYRAKGKASYVMALAQAGVFLVGAVLPLILGFTDTALFWLGLLYALAIIAGRVLSIIQDHRVLRVLWNLLCILTLLSSSSSFLVMDVLIFFLAVLSLMRIIFSRINLHMLLKIVRKTYAAEIIFGLFLLILTFSFLLYYFEPGIDSLKDALWYCFAIVTTIGFGDLTAVTDFGRILSVILGIYGIVVVALITSIIVNFYEEMKNDDNDSEEGDSVDT